MAELLGISDLDEWADNQMAAYNLSKSDQARITKAGADVLKKAMNDYLKTHHHSNRKTGEEIHLSDAVISQSVNLSGEQDGVSLVGFPSKKAYIANFLSNGTKYIKGDDFLDKIRNSSLDGIYEAENMMYHKILKEKGLE